MGKNKRWKREAKRLKGKSNNFDYDCFFCPLEKMNNLEEGNKCKISCEIGIRALENKCKK